MPAGSTAYVILVPVVADGRNRQESPLAAAARNLDMRWRTAAAVGIGLVVGIEGENVVAVVRIGRAEWWCTVSRRMVSGLGVRHPRQDLGRAAVIWWGQRQMASEHSESGEEPRLEQGMSREVLRRFVAEQMKRTTLSPMLSSVIAFPTDL